MIIQFNFLKYVYFLYDGSSSSSDALIVVLSLSVSVTSLLLSQSVYSYILKQPKKNCSPFPCFPDPAAPTRLPCLNPTHCQFLVAPYLSIPIPSQNLHRSRRRDSLLPSHCLSHSLSTSSSTAPTTKTTEPEVYTSGPPR